MSNLPQSDQTSLLVPIHLDAWVVDGQTHNEETLAIYSIAYDQLRQMQSPLPLPFHTSDIKPDEGIHLHWALPDALTRGRGDSAANRRKGLTGKAGDKAQADIGFPLAPNRWLIARFEAAAQWEARLWVIQSDYLDLPVGSTASDIPAGSSSIPLAAPGALDPIFAGQKIELDNSITVTVTAAVAQGDQTIPISALDLRSNVSAHSSVVLTGSSKFLDPFQPTSVDAGSETNTQFTINEKKVGASFTLEAWEARKDPAGELFVRTVGPGNAAFAAYAPFAQDVFSFIDPAANLPGENMGVHNYTYMVVGWYSDPSTADPLRGVNSFIPGVWDTEDDWSKQNPIDRFNTLLNDLAWSVDDDSQLQQPPSTSLYHSVLASVQWPPPVRDLSGIDLSNVKIAIGNTSAEALAALIEAEARALANKDSSNLPKWLQASNLLAELMRAAQYDLLDTYGKPGGAALIDQQARRAQFGSDLGGTIWKVAAKTATTPGRTMQAPQLTADQQSALNKQLASLNLAQRNLDVKSRRLKTMQADLHRLWWKVAFANRQDPFPQPETIPDWDCVLKPALLRQIYPKQVTEVWKLSCHVSHIQAQFPSPVDATQANVWAKQNWAFPGPKGTILHLDDLGLELKAEAMLRFYHPNDPVLLMSGLHRARKHGEDGRFSDDNKMHCRLPGQTITGIQVTVIKRLDSSAGTQVRETCKIDAAMVSKATSLQPQGTPAKVPGIDALVQEAFWVDPANAGFMASALMGVADAKTKLETAITDWLNGESGAINPWLGSSPLPFATVLWSQAWAPLFLEWRAHFYPTGSGQNSAHRFSMDDWSFDGTDYDWKQTGVDAGYKLVYTGRTMLTPHAALTFQDKVAHFLKDPTGGSTFDSDTIDQLLATIDGWDLLSQSISGFSIQLITLLSQETLPPPGIGKAVPCPPGASPLLIGALIGDQYQNVPVLFGVGLNDPNFMVPIRAGLLHFEKDDLQIVDCFGQALRLSLPNSTSGFDLLAPADLPLVQITGIQGNLIQLPPRLIQSARLDFQFLENSGSGHDIAVADTPDAICGWLLPNHLDGGLAVYDQTGILLGELLPGDQSPVWRSRPGAADAEAIQSPSAIPNTALKGVVSSIAGRSSDVFTDLLRLIDETLWMIDPLGGRKDQFLSVLIGRPLAVVQARLQLRLNGDPAVDQTWNRMLKDKTSTQWLRESGEVEDTPFAVRLGNLDLRNDGLLGYFKADGEASDYSTFYSVHQPQADQSFIRQIVARSAAGPNVYQGDLLLRCEQDTTTLTLILDPRGSVHAYTGILPVVAASLPAQAVEEFLAGLSITFRTGPIIADPGTLRTPKPAEAHGVWTWIQQIAEPANWEMEPIIDSDDRTRLPDGQLTLREGWLELSHFDEGE